MSFSCLLLTPGLGRGDEMDMSGESSSAFEEANDGDAQRLMPTDMSPSSSSLTDGLPCRGVLVCHDPEPCRVDHETEYSVAIPGPRGNVRLKECARGVLARTVGCGVDERRESACSASIFDYGAVIG